MRIILERAVAVPFMSIASALAFMAHAGDLHLTVHYDYMVLPDQGTACSVRTDCSRGQACVANICRGHSHRPDPLAIAAVVEAFSRQGVRLEIDPVSRAIPERQVVTLSELFVPACSGNDAVTLDSLRNEVGRTHDPHAHYAVFGHRAVCPNTEHCVACRERGLGTYDPTSTGISQLPGKSFAVTLGAYIDAGESTPLELQAGTFMHELGHNLGLHHGGASDDEYNYKPNYISVMSYSYQMNGIPFAEAPGSALLKACTTHDECRPSGYCAEYLIEELGAGYCFRIDYSRAALPVLNEFTPPSGLGGLDENVGVSGDPTSTDLVLYFAPGPTQLLAPSFGPIDWNNDGSSTGTHVASDLNNDGFLGRLRGFDDWLFVRDILAAGGIPPWARGRPIGETASKVVPR